MQFSSDACLAVHFRMIVKGYRKNLTPDDMFLLNLRDQSDTIVRQFEAQWSREVVNKKTQNCHSANEPKLIRGVDDNANKDSLDQVTLNCSFLMRSSLCI